MNNPKVSIIIPVYNGSAYLNNAIDCALNQTYENIEVIVVNDGSTDNGATETIALSYGDSIRYFCKNNGGVSSALNFGIERMTGEYFSWLSHDDAYSITKVEDSINLLRKNNLLSNNCMAFTGGYFIDSDGKKIGDFKTYFRDNCVYCGKEVVEVMTNKGTLNGCCMLIPKVSLVKVGGFHEGLRYSQDSLMWYQLFLSGTSLISDNKPNVMYRLHRNQTSQIRRDLYEHDAKEIAVILAKPLFETDNSGKTLYRYIKRLMHYQCMDAINYLCEFAENNNTFTNNMWLSLKFWKIFGYFRYLIVNSVKRTLLKLKR